MKRPIAFAATILVALLLSPPLPACRIPDIRPWPPPPHPWPRPQPPPALLPVLTRAHQADIRIVDLVASVSVTATFHNPNDTAVEGTYFFPIEPDAVVKGFSLTADGKKMEAELLEADAARRTYEEIVRKLRDPALLEFVGTRMLKARVFPIPARGEVAVALRYEQVVRFDHGLCQFRYPLRSAQPNAGRIDRLAVSAAVAGDIPVKLFYSPSHTIDAVRGDKQVTGGFEQRDALPERDFELYWSRDAAPVDVTVAAYKPAGEDGYCLVALAPRTAPVAGAAALPRDMVFAFDTSGSMDGEKIKQARAALRYGLNRLRPADRFALITFSSAVEALTEGLVAATPEAVARARERVETMEARGGTAIHEAVTRACQMLAATNGPAGRLRLIVFLTDGRPTVGPSDIGEILAAAIKANRGGARLFAFGVGHDLHTDLLDRLATENGGAQQYVAENEDIEVKVSAFNDKIANPVLSGIALAADGIELLDLYPRRPPDLFAGGQALLFGRYRGGGRHTVVARGRLGEKEAVFEGAADFDGSERHSFLPALWAQRKVAFLLEEIRLRGHSKELVDEIVALGKRHGIATPYTSFLAMDDRAPQAAAAMQGLRRGFEGNKSGRDGVAFSRDVAAAKEYSVAAGGAAAPMAIGMGTGYGAQDPGDGWSSGQPAQPRLRRIGGRVFLRGDDGVYYDSRFEEGMRGAIVEVTAFSDAWFKLLDRHPGIGAFLAVKNVELVVCIEGKVYRLGRK